MGKQHRPDDETRRKIERTAEVLTRAMDATGFDHRKLAIVTGYSDSFVRGTAHATQWSLPSRPALTFMFDVMGVDHDDPGVKEVLGYAHSRGVCRPPVQAAMEAFYGRAPGTKADPEPIVVEEVSPPAGTTLATRTAAVDDIMNQLCVLVNVGWDDVLEWLEANASSMNDSDKAAVMRAVWS